MGPRAPWWLALVLVAAVAWVYAPVGGHDWVRYDDDVYVLENPHVAGGLTPASLRWAWTSGDAGNYHPLTWSSHLLDVELFGLAPGPHHWVNVALHALASVLALQLLAALLGNVWAAGLGAAAFALHPLRVESVAWIAERKDVLCAVLVLAAAALHLRHGRAPSPARALAVAAVFALALLAKPMAVSFPLVALLLDHAPLGRYRTVPARRLVLEKLPLFALAALSALATLWAQGRAGSTSSLAGLALEVRVLNALRSLAVYLAQSFVPRGLSVFYPHAASVAEAPLRALWPGALAGAVLLALLLFLAWRLRRSAPAITVGIGIFLVTLAPVIGLVQVGTQAHADRYTYLPSLGLAAAVAAGALRLGRGRVVAGLALLGVVALAGLARRQLGHWRDTRTLFTHALALDPRNYLALTKLGELALAEGELDAARSAFERALALQPRFAHARGKLALCALASGELDAAREHLLAARALEPDDEELALNLGVVELERGALAAAAALFEGLLARDPANADARFDLGLVAQRAGRGAEAERHFEAVLALAPQRADAWSQLGQVRLARGEVAGAVAAFRSALERAPDDPLSHFNLGVALERSGDAAGARAAYREALALDPELEPARRALLQDPGGG